MEAKNYVPIKFSPKCFIRKNYSVQSMLQFYLNYQKIHFGRCLKIILILNSFERCIILLQLQNKSIQFLLDIEELHLDK